MKILNFDIQDAEKSRLMQLNEMDEFCHDAYENARIYKECTKKWHDNHIVKREFHEGQQVLLYSSWLHLFPGKLKSRWIGPYTITKVFPYGAVEIFDESKGTFKVNGHRLKNYINESFEKEKEAFQLQDPR